MKLPTFDGNIRDFPRFMCDFETHVLPNLQSKESAPYILRSCLTGVAFETVRNVDTSLKEMLERLNDRFGRPSKLVDVIMNDIKNIRPVTEGDEKGFLKIVNLIENSYTDLSRINMEQEISNSTIVSMVEERLPKSIKAQWCLKMCDNHDRVDDRDKFPAFLDFLLKHKRAVEYGSSSLRAGTQQRYGSTNFGQLEQKRSRTEREECWIHKSMDDGHPIWRCREFLSMTVPERKKLVLSNKACMACLLMKCPGVSSVEHCWGRFRCRETGCGKRHNQLLHTIDSESHTGISNHTIGEETTSESGAAILPIQEL